MHATPSSTRNKLNAVDNWRRRVLFRGPKQRNESQAKDFEKQIAVLRVAFPFLTESQIRGKAWRQCGFNSVMGGVPRSGLSPEVKRKLSKRKAHSPLTMPKRSKQKLIKQVQDDELHSEDSSGLSLSKKICKGLAQNDEEINFKPNVNLPNLQSGFLCGSYTPMSGVNVLSDFSYGIVKKNEEQERKNSSIIKKIKVKNHIVEETPTSSLASGHKTFYCSQNLYEGINKHEPNVMQCIVPSVKPKVEFYSQYRISECSTSLKTDGSKTVSGLDDSQSIRTNYPSLHKSDNYLIDSLQGTNSIKNQGYVMSQLYDSQTTIAMQNIYPDRPNQEYIMSQLYDSNSFVSHNQYDISNLTFQNTAAVSSTMNESQKQENIDDPQIPEGKGFSALNKSMCTPSGRQSNLNLGEYTPVKSTSKKRMVRRKIKFETQAEVYDKHVSAVRGNHAKVSWLNEVSCVQNITQNAPATTSFNFSMINNPPTKVFVDEEKNMHLDQPKLCNELFNSDFNENTENTTIVFDSQKLNDSFSSTPTDVDPLALPPSLLLSNFCSEYDKAYTIKDLKPNQYRNYRHHESLKSLKEHLDSIIPPHMTLRKFYKIKNLP